VTEEAENAVFVAELEQRLREVDINLLIAMDALLSYRNVSLAARRLGITQPATSRILAKLRDFLGDDLLVRGSTGMRLTKRAEYLSQLVPLAISQARGIIGTRDAEGGPRISVSVNLMPALLPHFARSSNLSGQRLQIASYTSTADAFTQLQSRVADFVISLNMPAADGFNRENICLEDFVTLVASKDDHASGHDRSAFLKLPHVRLVDGGADIFSQMTEVLIANGLRVSDMVEFPSVTSAAIMVSQADFALTVPRSIAGWLTRTHRLLAFPPPFLIPKSAIDLIWMADGIENSSAIARDLMLVARQAIAEEQATVNLR